MTLAGIRRKYKGEFVVLQPHLRDAVTDKPKSFNVLKPCPSAAVAVKAQGYYISEGFVGAFIFPCVEEDITLEPQHVARMFRILYGGDA